MLSSAPRQIDRRPRRPATQIPTVCVVDPQADDSQDWIVAHDVGSARVYCLPSAEDALRFARLHPVHLWLVNTKLPGLSGLELCSMLKARTSETAIYVVGDGSPAEERAAWAARASIYGSKAAQWDLLNHWLRQRHDRGVS